MYNHDISAENDRSIKNHPQKDEKQNNTLSIANINDKLEITNITNIVTNTEERQHKGFAGWANGGETFYIKSIIPFPLRINSISPPTQLRTVEGV